MTIDKKILYSVYSVFVAVLLLAFFLPGEYSGRITAAFLLLPLVFLTRYFVKKRIILSMNKREVTMLVAGVACVVLILYYLIGLFVGFYRSLNKDSLTIFFASFLPIAVTIVTTEMIRHVARAQDDKIADVLSYLGCVIAEVLVVGNVYMINSFNAFMNVFALTLFPAIVANLLYHYLSRRYGIYPNIVYRAITTLYAYVIPYRPALSDSLLAFAKLLLPIAIFFFIDSLYEKKKRIALEKQSKLSIVFAVVAITIMVSFIALISNHFKYGTLVIATESMTGEINKADAIIFERYDDQIILEGQIIVFEKNNSKIVHRVVDIQNVDGTTFYFTKGDANEDIDSGFVTKSEIFGLVKFRIPYVGYPTVLLRELFSK